ncbi:MAG: hypothetical protein MZV65_42090 [Chromatiales bacterium]|nr:hypothetical protein [Chromatiales bacterium]
MEGAADDQLLVNARHNSISGSPTGINVDSYVTLLADYNIISDANSAAIYKDAAVVSTSITCSKNLFWNIAPGGYEESNCTNSMSGDPLYGDLSGGDLHIRVGSAAIDRLTDTTILTDMDGQPRPMGSGTNPWDVGADEFWFMYFLPDISKQIFT